MKSRMILIIVLSAVITLSFTFAATRNSESKVEPDAAKSQNAPVGGFVSEDSK